MSATARCRPCVPPVYDNAYTRGVFDPTTRVYFAADAFCAPMPAEPVDRVDQMPEQMWAEGFALFHHNSLCPWITLVDAARYEAEVAKLAAIGAEVITSAARPDHHLHIARPCVRAPRRSPDGGHPTAVHASGEQVARHAAMRRSRTAATREHRRDRRLG